MKVHASPDGPPWLHVANMFLGLWLIGTVLALGMTGPALLWSDLAIGLTVLLFSALAIRHTWAAWTVCGVCGGVMSAPRTQSSSRSS